MTTTSECAGEGHLIATAQAEKPSSPVNEFGAISEHQILANATKSVPVGEQTRTTITQEESRSVGQKLDELVAANESTPGSYIQYEDKYVKLVLECNTAE